MFDNTVESIENDHVAKYALTRSGVGISYAQVIELWQSDDRFRSYFAALLAQSSFAAFRWETPPITNSSVERPFEFVLINSPGFNSRQTDSNAYNDYFTTDDAEQGVVAFENLGKDATLIVPSPRTDNDAYGHLAAFVRRAPKDQVDALWRVVGSTAINHINDSPLWLSTAGGGVAWLHIRLDSRPKYYGYAPYKNNA